MAAVVRTSVTAQYQGVSPATALPMTCVAGDRLILLPGAHNSNAGVLSGATFNGVAFTSLGSKTDVIIGSSVWYLDNPTVGTFNLVLSSASSFSALGYCCAAISGANLGTPPVIGTGLTASSASASCAVTAGGANDIYLASCMVNTTALTPGGGNQTNLALQTSINGTDSFSADSIAGSNAGNFAWTLTSAPWTAIGVLVQGAASGKPHIPKWVPFRWACAMRSLQQGALNVGSRQQNRVSLLASAITNANGAATWAKWRVGNVSRTSSAALLINVPLVPGLVSPVGTSDDSV